MRNLKGVTLAALSSLVLIGCGGGDNTGEEGGGSGSPQLFMNTKNIDALAINTTMASFAHAQNDDANICDQLKAIEYEIDYEVAENGALVPVEKPVWVEMSSHKCQVEDIAFWGDTMVTTGRFEGYSYLNEFGNIEEFAGSCRALQVELGRESVQPTCLLQDGQSFEHPSGEYIETVQMHLSDTSLISMRGDVNRTYTVDITTPAEHQSNVLALLDSQYDSKFVGNENYIYYEAIDGHYYLYDVLNDGYIIEYGFAHEFNFFTADLALITYNGEKHAFSFNTGDLKQVNVRGRLNSFENFIDYAIVSSVDGLGDYVYKLDENLDLELISTLPMGQWWSPATFPEVNYGVVFDRHGCINNQIYKDGEFRAIAGYYGIDECVTPTVSTPVGMTLLAPDSGNVYYFYSDADLISERELEMSEIATFKRR
ncbi:hypothetical protein ACPV5R_18655 [Vibrio astriarenae]